MKTCLCCSIFIVSILFISCEKDDFPNENREGTLLKEVVSSDEPIYSYIYTSSNLISEEKSKFHYTKYTYNSRNQVIQSDHYWDEGIYSSNWFTLQETLKRTEWVSPENSERDTYNTYEYNRSGRLEKIVNRTNNNYSAYTCEKGKIVKRTSYHENKAYRI